MIDAAIQAELREKFNPDGSRLRNIQLRQLEMLKYIDSVCGRIEAKYWLSSGTCLGAVRHGGFIPWDDDIDIEMLESDYARLIDYLRKHETDEFVLQTHEDDPNYIMDFAKLRDKTTHVNENFGIDKLYKYQGLYIDIFRMTPSNSVKLHYFCGRLRVLEVYCKRWAMNSRIGKCVFPLLRVLNNLIIGIIKPIDRINAKSQLRHPLGSVFLKARCKEDVQDTIRIPFEGILLPVPRNYDAYLKKLYGEYMELQQEHTHIKD
ncbi:MAG: LicD family protein [Bacteroides sp.]|nr:LicD family protein [Bacteroides sp.]